MPVDLNDHPHAVHDYPEIVHVRMMVDHQKRYWAIPASRTGGWNNMSLICAIDDIGPKQLPLLDRMPDVDVTVASTTSFLAELSGGGTRSVHHSLKKQYHRHITYQSSMHPEAERSYIVDHGANIDDAIDLDEFPSIDVHRDVHLSFAEYVQRMVMRTLITF